jgi:hypothetical protein
MNYKQWSLLIKKELNGIAVDYIDPSGQLYSEPFCFYTLEEALSYGKICIDKYTRSGALLNKGISTVSEPAMG